MPRVLNSVEAQLLAWWMGVRHGHKSSREQNRIRSGTLRQLRREPDRHEAYFRDLNEKREDYLRRLAVVREEEEGKLLAAQGVVTDAMFRGKSRSWQ